MFEFDQYRGKGAGAPLRPSESIAFVSGIRKRSLLIWGEHCIECAAPECYQTCDLYRARPDQRCRRFELGMRRNRHFRAQTGPAAEIVFGQWGKLEARGNTLLWRNGLVSLLDRVVPRVQPLVNAFGRLVRRFGGSPPWTSLAFELLDYLGKRMHKALPQEQKPDGFLIEIYNPQTRDCKMKFACAVARSAMLSVPANGKLALPYWKQLVLAPGYNRYFIPHTELSAITDSRLPYNISFTPEAESGTRLVFISADFITADSVATINPVSVATGDTRPAAKCVVFDLDNTLWDGVLLEGEVTLKSTVPALFKALDQRGILITVASKNNRPEALQQLEQFGLADYLVYPVINWNQKSENIKWLAEKISIGTDTLVFIDDTPFEREEVAAAVNGIEVLPETAIETLLEHPRLQGSTTAEAGNRRLMYQQQVQRSEDAVRFGDDYLAFLRACQIVVTISPYASEQHTRVTELLQRTNQLNFSGTRYTREAVDEALQNTATDKHVIHCKDKYGDYGLVGFSITRREQHGRITVEDFMLSCRVQGKLIEKAFFSYLIDEYGGGAATLAVNFVATDRNGLARSVLQEIGFSMSAGSMATLAVQPGQLDVDFLTLQSAVVPVAGSTAADQAHIS